MVGGRAQAIVQVATCELACQEAREEGIPGSIAVDE
jgi:hypothetical protein